MKHVGDARPSLFYALLIATLFLAFGVSDEILKGLSQ